MNSGLVFAVGLLLGTALACGGGGTAAPSSPPVTQATRLSYVDPPGAAWRFVKTGGTGTSADPLILELRGPALPRVKGAAFFLDLGTSPKVAWVPLGQNAYAGVTGTLDLGTDPRLFKDRLTANELQVGIFQKTGDADSSLGLVRVALRLNEGQSLGMVPITQESAKAAVLHGDGTALTPQTILLGTLRAE